MRSGDTGATTALDVRCVEPSLVVVFELEPVITSDQHQRQRQRQRQLLLHRDWPLSPMASRPGREVIHRSNWGTAEGSSLSLALAGRGIFPGVPTTNDRRP